MTHRWQPAPRAVHEEVPEPALDAGPPYGRRGAVGDAPTTAPPLGQQADREVERRIEHEPTRSVFDEESGRRWAVREVDARCVPAARGERCLIFDATDIVRRVWSYPADWRQLPAGELLVLLGQR